MRLGLGVLFLTVTLPAAADMPWSRGGAQITVTIEHEAQVKTPLQQVAFAEPTGKCADLLSDSLVADFAMNGATVIDRQNFKRIMAEHKLNLSGAIDQKTAAKIGKLLGAGSLIFIKVHECNTYRTREIHNSVDGLGVSRTPVPTTRGTLKASLQVVNLTTGVTSAARVIDVKTSLAADEMDTSKVTKVKEAAVSFLKGAKKFEDYPPDEEVQTRLFVSAVEQVHQMLFSWTETRQFPFFNDSECGLQSAFRLMQTGEYDAAGRESQANLDQCKASTAVKPAILARAYYNRGMTLYLAEDFTNALAHLTRAAGLDPGKTFTDAMKSCSRARADAIAAGRTKPVTPTQQAALDGPPAAPSKTSQSATDAKLPAEERLKRLEELRKKKLISDDEYERKRKEILAEL